MIMVLFIKTKWQQTINDLLDCGTIGFTNYINSNLKTNN